MPDTATDVWVMFGAESVLAGHLWSHRRGRTESATFAYYSGYLARPDEAEEILVTVRAATDRWSEVAEKADLRRPEIEAMATAFESAPA
jgi:hypothetical protein